VQEFSVSITRRRLLAGTASLALIATALSVLDLNLVSRAQAQSPSAADLAVVGPLGERVLGRDDAPVTIIEYSSMTCGHCANFHNTTFPELKSRFIDTGKVRYILREFPLDPLAAGAFMLAHCAGEGKFFPMIEILFQKQKEWVVQKPIEPLLAIAKQTGFTEESFNACLQDQKLLENIEAVRARASEKLGVNSTPTFFINGRIQRGAISIEEFEKLITPYLKG
jgi:protein-disulfide isomerase